MNEDRSGGGEATARVREAYDRMAGRYDTAIAVAERALFAGGRQWAAAQSAGDVLELGIGTGRNLGHYPADVRVAGVDISEEMLAIARGRARALGLDVDLRAGDVEELDWPDASVDTVVSTLSLCTIPDEWRAVAEARRVLRPGGRLVLLEHVRSPVRAVRVGQELVEPLFLWLQRDHLLREPRDVVRCHGFVLEQLTRAKWGLVERLVARKPA